MIEAAQVLAVLSALLILASVVIGANRLQGPLLQRLDGLRASNAVPAATVLRLLVAAVLLSTLAAVLAVAGLFAA